MNQIDLSMTHPGSARRANVATPKKLKKQKSSNSAAYDMMFGSTPVSEKPEGNRQFEFLWVPDEIRVDHVLKPQEKLLEDPDNVLSEDGEVEGDGSASPPFTVTATAASPNECVVSYEPFVIWGLGR